MCKETQESAEVHQRTRGTRSHTCCYRWCNMRGRASQHRAAVVRMIYVLGLLTLCVTETYGANTLSHFLQQRMVRGHVTDPLDVVLRQQCPPEVSILDCYIRVMALMRDDDTRAALESRLERVCPESHNHFRCFYNYVNGVLNIHKGQVAVAKRRSDGMWQLCPASMRTVDCFDSYMALWLKLVTSQEGKRTFAGKRSGEDPAPAVTAQGHSNLEVVYGNDEDFHPNQDGGCVERFGRESCLKKEIKELAAYLQHARQQHQLKQQKQLDDEFNPKQKRSMASLCRDIDPVKCFEHYIFQLARYENKKQKVKGFIGK